MFIGQVEQADEVEGQRHIALAGLIPLAGYVGDHVLERQLLLRRACYVDNQICVNMVSTPLRAFYILVRQNIASELLFTTSIN